MASLHTGRDLKEVLVKRNLLVNDAGIQTMKEVLQSIERADLATKLDKYLEIGQYIDKSLLYEIHTTILNASVRNIS